MPSSAQRTRASSPVGRHPQARRLKALRTSPEPTLLGLRERKKARLRQQIVDTAIELFRTKGYEGTTVEDIVHPLEVSPATFYNYFPSKDAVVRDFGLRVLALYQEALKSELSSNATTKTRLRHLFTTLGEALMADKPLARAIFRSGALRAVGSPETQEADETAVGLLQEIIAEGQRRGELTTKLSAELLTQVLEASLVRIATDWALDLHAPHSLVKRLLEALALFLRGARP